MGKLIALLVVASIAGGVYWAFFYQSPALQALLAFEADASKGDCPALYARVQDQAKEWIDDYCTPGGGKLSTGSTYGGASAASVRAALVGSKDFERLLTEDKVESQTKAADGSVEIVLKERPSHPNVLTMAHVERHTAKLKKFGEQWKLVAYKAEVLHQ